MFKFCSRASAQLFLSLSLVLLIVNANAADDAEAPGFKPLSIPCVADLIGPTDAQTPRFLKRELQRAYAWPLKNINDQLADLPEVPSLFGWLSDIVAALERDDLTEISHHVNTLWISISDLENHPEQDLEAYLWSHPPLLGKLLPLVDGVLMELNFCLKKRRGAHPRQVEATANIIRATIARIQRKL